MTMKEKNKIILWVEGRLAFVEKLIEDAQNTSNYGKELHFSAQKEAYFAMLEKLRETRA